MRKLILKIDDLEVVSFETAGQAEARGTVKGHNPPRPSFPVGTCEEPTYGMMEQTCAYTCPAACVWMGDTSVAGCTGVTVCGGCQYSD